MTPEDVLRQFLQDHLWAGFPPDEATCCARGAVEALREAGFQILRPVVLEEAHLTAKNTTTAE